MANEISATGSLSFLKSTVMGSGVGRALTSSFTVTGSTYIEGNVSIATSATAIPLGGVTSPHWAFFYNTDTTNYLTIRNGSGGADLLKLKATEWALCPLYDSATPYAVANTAACILEYLIVSL